MVRATRYSHQLNPVFTPPMRRLLRSLGTATLATVDDARVGPRSLETEGSGSTFLGRYHSGIYRDSSLNRLYGDSQKTMNSQSGPSTPSTPRSTPGARGDERRARWHAGAIGQPPRTLRSTRAGLFLHDQLRRLAKNATFPAAVKVMIKTLSTDAAAWTVPPAIGPDRASPFWARSEHMRSMFSVLISKF